MPSGQIPHSFIVIEGNIGAGKSTLSSMISSDTDRRLILEEFSDNPFLPFFYENRDRYAFPVELFFMTERHKQLEEELKQIQLFEQGTVADYFFLKTLLFARHTLSAEEFRLFQRLFNILSVNFPKPDIILYLHKSVDGLLANIKKRGRDYEQQMDPNYLLKIQHAYFDYFKSVTDVPVLILDVETVDFVENPDQYQEIVRLLSQKYSPGIHHLQGDEIFG